MKPMITYAFDCRLILYVVDDCPIDAAKQMKQRLESLAPGAWKIERMGERRVPFDE